MATRNPSCETGQGQVPEGQWNATIKKICARLLILQCQRTGNIAYVTRQAFQEKTVETVDGGLVVCVPITKHKVSRYKKAFLTMSVEDYEELVMPFVIAAGQRAKAAHHRDSAHSHAKKKSTHVMSSIKSPHVRQLLRQGMQGPPRKFWPWPRPLKYVD